MTPNIALCGGCGTLRNHSRVTHLNPLKMLAEPCAEPQCGTCGTMGLKHCKSVVYLRNHCGTTHLSIRDRCAVALRCGLLAILVLSGGVVGNG